jgi:hypothetical protein
MNAAGYFPRRRIIDAVTLGDLAGVIGEETGRAYPTRSIIIDPAPAAVGLCRNAVDPGTGIFIADDAIPCSVLGVAGQEEQTTKEGKAQSGNSHVQICGKYGYRQRVSVTHLFAENCGRHDSK